MYVECLKSAAVQRTHAHHISSVLFFSGSQVAHAAIGTCHKQCKIPKIKNNKITNHYPFKEPGCLFMIRFVILDVLRSSISSIKIISNSKQQDKFNFNQIKSKWYKLHTHFKKIMTTAKVIFFVNFFFLIHKKGCDESSAYIFSTF